LECGHKSSVIGGWLRSLTFALGCVYMTKPLRNIIGVSAVHFAVSFGAFWHSLGSSLGRFDTGLEASRFDKACSGAVDVLWFPFVWAGGLLHVQGPGIAKWLLMIANSLLWGVALYGLSAVLGRVLHLRQLRSGA
jgi:hypothetical protein